MRFSLTVVFAVCLAGIVGCHSAYIETTIVNHTSTPIPLIEVDYPSASFGTQNLAPGASFRYRFKVLGSGPTKLLYTDSAHHDQTSAGPVFKEGDQGTLTLTIGPQSSQWNFARTNP